MSPFLPLVRDLSLRTSQHPPRRGFVGTTDHDSQSLWVRNTTRPQLLHRQASNGWYLRHLLIRRLTFFWGGGSGIQRTRTNPCRQPHCICPPHSGHLGASCLSIPFPFDITTEALSRRPCQWFLSPRANSFPEAGFGFRPSLLHRVSPPQYRGIHCPAQWSCNERGHSTFSVQGILAHRFPGLLTA
jgi:hypothetical protein